jgi:hypothetical protein
MFVDDVRSCYSYVGTSPGMEVVFGLVSMGKRSSDCSEREVQMRKLLVMGRRSCDFENAVSATEKT